MDRDNRKSHLAPQLSPATQDLLRSSDSPTFATQTPTSGELPSRDHNVWHSDRILQHIASILARRPTTPTWLRKWTVCTSGNGTTNKHLRRSRDGLWLGHSARYHGTHEDRSFCPSQSLLYCNPLAYAPFRSRGQDVCWQDAQVTHMRSSQAQHNSPQPQFAHSLLISFQRSGEKVSPTCVMGASRLEMFTHAFTGVILSSLSYVIFLYYSERVFYARKISSGHDSLLRGGQGDLHGVCSHWTSEAAGQQDLCEPFAWGFLCL